MKTLLIALFTLVCTQVMSQVTGKYDIHLPTEWYYVESVYVEEGDTTVTLLVVCEPKIRLKIHEGEGQWPILITNMQTKQTYTVILKPTGTKKVIDVQFNDADIVVDNKSVVRK